MIKAIIFDCFGVLVGRGFRETYRQAGGDPYQDAAFIEEVLEKADLGLISSREMSQKFANKLGIPYEKWREVVLRAEQPQELLIDYIRGLKSLYKVAILSNANIGTLERKFNPGQLDLFDEVIVSAEVKMLKPNAEIYYYTAEKLDVLTEECIFVDDNPGHCEAARAVGMHAICYQDFQRLKLELEELARVNQGR